MSILSEIGNESNCIKVSAVMNPANPYSPTKSRPSLNKNPAVDNFAHVGSSLNIGKESLPDSLVTSFEVVFTVSLASSSVPALTNLPASSACPEAFRISL